MRRLFPDHRSARFYVVAALSLLLMTTAASMCFGAELRPYQLPSQQRPIYQQQTQQGVAAPGPRVSGGFDYEAYGARASRLSSEDRQRLKEGLQQKLSQAVEEKNYPEAAHYAKLLDIVKNIR